MENYQKEVQEAVDVLKSAYKKIETILAAEDIVFLKNRLLRVIDKEITGISIQHGLNYEAKYSEPVAGEPLKKIMGRVIEVKEATDQKQLVSDKPVQEKLIQKSAQEVEAEEFKEKTVELYSKFADIENEAILDQFEDMVIRGVGKLAGLPVTEQHPKNVDVKFVNEIKDTMQKKDEFEKVTGGSSITVVNTGAPASTVSNVAAGSEKQVFDTKKADTKTADKK